MVLLVAIFELSFTGWLDLSNMAKSSTWAATVSLVTNAALETGLPRFSWWVSDVVLRLPFFAVVSRTAVK